MNLESYKRELDALLTEAAMRLSADDFEELIAWLVNESGCM